MSNKPTLSREVSAREHAEARSHLLRSIRSGEDEKCVVAQYRTSSAQKEAFSRLIAGSSHDCVRLEWVIEIADESNGWFYGTAYHFNYAAGTVHVMVPDKENATFAGEVQLDYRTIHLIECVDGDSAALFNHMVRSSVLKVKWDLEYLDDALQAQEAAHWVASTARYFIRMANQLLVEDRGTDGEAQGYVMVSANSSVRLLHCHRGREEFQRLIDDGEVLYNTQSPGKEKRLSAPLSPSTQSLRSLQTGLSALTEQRTAVDTELAVLQAKLSRANDHDKSALQTQISSLTAKALALEREISIAQAQLLVETESKSLQQIAAKYSQPVPVWASELAVSPQALEAAAAEGVEAFTADPSQVQQLFHELETLQDTLSTVKQATQEGVEKKFRTVLADPNSVMARGAMLDAKYRDFVEQYFLQKHPMLLEVAEAIEDRFNEHFLFVRVCKESKFAGKEGKVARALGFHAMLAEQQPFIASSPTAGPATGTSAIAGRYEHLHALASTPTAAAAMAKKIGRKVALTDQRMILSKADRSDGEFKTFCGLLAGSCLEVVLQGSLDVAAVKEAAKSKLNRDWVDELIEQMVLACGVIVNKKMFILGQNQLRQLTLEMSKHQSQSQGEGGTSADLREHISRMEEAIAALQKTVSEQGVTIKELQEQLNKVALA